MTGELGTKKCVKPSNTVRLILYNSHICCVSNINALLKTYLCPSWDKFFSRAPKLELHLTTCSKSGKHVYTNLVYKLRKTLFDNFDSFDILRWGNQKFFKNMPLSDFESICVENEHFKDTEKTTCMGKHMPCSLSVSAILIEEFIFVCGSNPHDLVSSFINVLDILVTQGKSQMELIIIQTETGIESTLAPVLETLNQLHCHSVGIEAEDDNSNRSTQIL